jgi:hypothetical protein
MAELCWWDNWRANFCRRVTPLLLPASKTVWNPVTACVERVGTPVPHKSCQRLQSPVRASHIDLLNYDLLKLTLNATCSMKYQFLILLLAFAPVIIGWGEPAAGAQAGAQVSSEPVAPKGPSIPVDQENARQARALLDQAIQALGGQAYLSVHDMEFQGRNYSFYHGRPTSNGVLFWRFVEYPEKERMEVTPQRDVAVIYVGNKGYEVTYKGPHALEKKDLDDYLRRRRLSLENVLRTWTNDPGVAFFYDGNALADNLPAQQITLIDSKNEAVSLYFDPDTHLPIKKTYKWRDPVDRELNVEEEIYADYKPVQGIMTPYSFTRHYNGDMQNQRFVSAVHYNAGVDEAMFDPNSGYNPNKPVKKH